MQLFVSWSGGKDCMLALYRVLQANEHEVSYLINMCDADGVRSRSHGMSKYLITKQALSIGKDIVQPVSDFKSYEIQFKEAIGHLKKKGITGGVFGDIYLKPHRDWIERVCSEMDIQPFFPLWGCSTIELIYEFINAGFKTIVVSVNYNHLAKSWLGRDIDKEFVSEIMKLDGIDPCAENGEYHSFVYDGPIFKTPVVFSREKEYFKDNHWFLELNEMMNLWPQRKE